MKIYNNNTTCQFGSRFNMENYSTNRALKALKRTISNQKGEEHLFDEFLSKIHNNKDDILELTQFDKYYIITNHKNTKKIKLRNKTLLEDVQEFMRQYIK